MTIDELSISAAQRYALLRADLAVASYVEHQLRWRALGEVDLDLVAQVLGMMRLSPATDARVDHAVRLEMVAP